MQNDNEKMKKVRAPALCDEVHPTGVVHAVGAGVQDHFCVLICHFAF
jgi:hypothetical protein